MPIVIGASGSGRVDTSFSGDEVKEKQIVVGRVRCCFGAEDNFNWVNGPAHDRGM